MVGAKQYLDVLIDFLSFESSKQIIAFHNIKIYMKPSSVHRILWKQIDKKGGFHANLMSSVKRSHWINGEYVSTGTEQEKAAISSPSDDKILGEVPCASPERIDTAVRAASAALNGWRRADRAPFFAALAKELAKERAALSRLESFQSGVAIRDIDFRSLLRECAAPLPSDDPTPVGVTAVLSSRCFPLIGGATDVVRALAKGSSVVWKPAETCPLSALRFANICHNAGLPRGVLNVVLGRGDVAGCALAGHFLVTGSVVVRGSHDTVTKVTALARGAHVISETNTVYVARDGASVDVAMGAFENAGYLRSRCAVVVMPKAQAGEFLDALVVRASTRRLGHAADPRTEQGPQRSDHDVMQVTDYVKSAQLVGGWDLAFGGFKVAFASGSYLAPTVLVKNFASEDLTPERLAQQSPRGPLLHVLVS